jgi:hypothetical protein
MGITIARHRCMDCRRTTRLAIWPWSGRLLVKSHGLCRGCRREREALLAGPGGSLAGLDRRVRTLG